MDYSTYVKCRPPSPPPLPCKKQRPSVRARARPSPFPPLTARRSAHQSAAAAQSRDVHFNHHVNSVRDAYVAHVRTLRTYGRTERQLESRHAVVLRLERLHLSAADDAAAAVVSAALIKARREIDRLLPAASVIASARQDMRAIERQHFATPAVSRNVPSDVRHLSRLRDQGLRAAVDIECALRDQARIVCWLATLRARLRDLLRDLRDARPARSLRAADGADGASGGGRTAGRSGRVAGRAAVAARAAAGGGSSEMGDDDGWRDRDDAALSAGLDAKATGSGRLDRVGMPPAHRRPGEVVREGGSPHRRSLFSVARGRAPDEPATPDRAGSRVDARVQERARELDGLRAMMPDAPAARDAEGGDRGRGRGRDLGKGMGMDMGMGEEGGKFGVRSWKSRLSSWKWQSRESSYMTELTEDTDTTLTTLTTLTMQPRFDTSGESPWDSSRGTHHTVHAPVSAISGARRSRLPRFVSAERRVKAQWRGINELYKMIVSYAPHLTDEKVILRAQSAFSLLGDWPASGWGKGDRATVMVLRRTVVATAMRKVVGVCKWQSRLVGDIRHDLLVQRKRLRADDDLLSQAYLACLHRVV